MLCRLWCYKCYNLFLVLAVPPLQVLKFNGLKWELQCHSVDYDSAISLSSRAVKCDGDIFMGVVSNHSKNILLLTTDSKSNPFYSCYEAGSILSCALTDGQTAHNSL